MRLLFSGSVIYLRRPEVLRGDGYVCFERTENVISSCSSDDFQRDFMPPELLSSRDRGSVHLTESFFLTLWMSLVIDVSNSQRPKLVLGAQSLQQPTYALLVLDADSLCGERNRKPTGVSNGVSQSDSGLFLVPESPGNLLKIEFLPSYPNPMNHTWEWFKYIFNFEILCLWG